MKYKVSLLSAALLLASNSWAIDGAPYYTIEEIDSMVDADNFGAYPSALSEDGQFIGTYTLKAKLSRDIDIGLPYTFNRECQFDKVLCELEFYGSQSTSDLSYENAYKKWRNAQSDISLGYSSSYTSYFMGNICSSLGAILNCTSDETQDNSIDAKITDVNNTIAGGPSAIGYASAPYINGKRDFVRRAVMKPNIGDEIQLLPTFGENGGFTSAYKIQEVTYANDTTKTLVVGSSSVSYPRNSDEYFRNCFFSQEYDNRFSKNDLVRCPGFDTQAWAWDVTDPSNVTSFALATEWLDNNSTNQGELTWSANAFDINAAGIAVGTSTFELYNNSEGGRQRAVIMQPDDIGNYTKPIEITDVTNDINDQDEAIYNTWAVAINEQNLITGNREYDYAKSRNKPVEFFTYAFDPITKTGTVEIPLLDKKVLTTQERLNGVSAAFSGTNSQALDINDGGIIVGETDDYDQDFPVFNGTPRGQTGFVYDSKSGKSWRLNDLICTETNGVVTSPLYRIRSARVINDAGVILAEGFKYENDNEYLYKFNAKEISFKLTPNSSFTVDALDNSPNCWESDLLTEENEPYVRQGASSFWLWIFALPLMLLRLRMSKDS